jgi:toxin secretion/phage lysis holin
MMQQVKHMVDDPLIVAFIGCVIADVITGYVRAAFVRKTNSTKGLFGLVKHTIVLVTIISIYPYLISLGYAWLAQTIVWGYIINYLTSITENWGEMGLWLPPQIKQILVKLQSDYDATDYNAITGAKQNKGGK